MRKLVLLMALICISATSYAQAYVGGTIGLSVDHTSSNGVSMTNSAFTLAPEGGYYFNETWAVGATLGITCQSISDMGVTTFAFLPYVRGTFAHAGVFDFFGEFALGYAHESADGYGASGFAMGLRPGFLAHLNDKFSILGRTTLLRYNHYDGVDGFGFAINSNFELGIQYSF